MNAIVPLQLNVLVIDKSSKGSICTIWQLCTLNITSFGSKARSAKLWELSSQGTEISPQDCQIAVTNDRYLVLGTPVILITAGLKFPWYLKYQEF